MRRWVALAGLGLACLALLAGLGLVAGSQTPDETVVAEPQLGDRGHYTGFERTVSPDGVENRTLNHTQVWTLERVWQPDGSHARLATLAYRYPAPDTGGDASNATDPAPLATPRPLADALAGPTEGNARVSVDLLDRAFHHTSLPGPAQAFSIGVLDQHTEDRFWRVFRMTGVSEGWCATAPTGPLVGTTPTEADPAVERCLREVPWGTTEHLEVDTGWQTHPDHGRTWHVDAAITYRTPDGVTANASIELVTSPHLSMPVEQRTAWTEVTHDGAERHVRAVELTGWAQGDGPLPDADPLPMGPRVPIVPWTEDGPREDWDPGLTFAEARDAIAATDTAKRFHAAHPEATLNMAIHLDRHADDRSTPATSAANLGKCESPAAEHLRPLAGTGPEEAGWALFYSGDTEDLYGLADRVQDPEAVGLLDDQPPEQAQASRFDSPGLVPGLELPTTGPAMHALREHLDMADRLGAQGDPYVAVLPPSGQGTVDAPDEMPLDGAVGRLRCTLDPATNTYSSQHTGVVFRQGEAAGVYTLEIEAVGEDGLGLTGLSPPPGSDADGGGLADGMAIGGLALAATGALGWAATRVLPSLYTRLTRRELLEHPVREAVYDGVDASPGVSLSELADGIDRHRSTVEYHVRRLDEAGLIEKVVTTSGAVCFPAEHPLADHADVLAKGQAREMIAAVRQTPGGTLTSYADRLDVSKGYVSRLAKDLEAAGLIERHREGRRLLIEPGPRAGLLPMASPDA